MKELSPFKKMGNLIMQKLFGGGGPLVEIETQGACSSECCDEVVSESSDSPTTTHPSRHAASSFGTIPPEIESIPCESGISAVEQAVSQTSGVKQDMKRSH